MILWLFGVFAIGVILVLSAVDQADIDQVALHAMGLVLIVRCWAWPNGPGTNIERKHWNYRPLHPYRGSPEMTGQPRPAGRIVAELRGARATLAEIEAARRLVWLSVP